MRPDKRRRAIYSNAFSMYALIEQVFQRSSDEVFREAARKMLDEIDYQAEAE